MTKLSAEQLAELNELAPGVQYAVELPGLGPKVAGQTHVLFKRIDIYGDEFLDPSKPWCTKWNDWSFGDNPVFFAATPQQALNAALKWWNS